jgi:hypothetical protein
MSEKKKSLPPQWEEWSEFERNCYLAANNPPPKKKTAKQKDNKKRKKGLTLGDINPDIGHFDIDEIVKGVTKLQEAGFGRFPQSRPK